MKTFIDEIAARTPRIFAKLAALSVVLGLLSVSLTQAPADIQALIPDELNRAAAYTSLASWAINLYCIAQREYEKRMDEAESTDQSTENDPQP